jgi:hypothetical protein
MSCKSTIITLESDDTIFRNRIATEELTKNLGLTSDTSSFLQTRHTSDEIVKFLADNQSLLTGARWLLPLEEDEHYEIVDSSKSGIVIKLEWFDSNKPICTMGDHFYVVFTATEGLQIPDGMISLSHIRSFIHSF